MSDNNNKCRRDSANIRVLINLLRSLNLKALCGTQKRNVRVQFLVTAISHETFDVPTRLDSFESKSSGSATSTLRLHTTPGGITPQCEKTPDRTFGHCALSETLLCFSFVFSPLFSDADV